MLRGYDANGNVLFEQTSPINYQQQQVMTPEQQFAINMQIYKQNAAARGVDMSPISEQQSQMLSYQNNVPIGTYQQQQPMCSYGYPHPAQQQAQQFLQQEYNNRIGGMGTPVYSQPYQQPYGGMQNGLIGYGVTADGQYYQLNNPYGNLQQQQQYIEEQKEVLRVQIEVFKKISRAAHTFLEIPISEEELDEMYNPKPQIMPTYEEQLEIQHTNTLEKLTRKVEYMEFNHVTEEEYDYMVAPPYVKQRIDKKNERDRMVHEAYKKIHPDDMSLADFLNGPANELYYDSLVMEVRNQKRARYLSYDQEKFRSYIPFPKPTTYVNLPDHLKRSGPSVVEALGVDDSWFSPEADQFRKEVNEALNQSGFRDPENYERRKLAFFEAVKNGR